jgi:alkylation response protein AidB-like acyl-CoA dehydrogenase
MMILNDEQRMLRDTIADFLAKESPVEALRALRDQAPELAWEPSLWSGLCELGAPAVASSEAEGGLGFGQVGMGALILETGRTLCASPLLSSAIHAQAVIRHCGSPAQIERRLPGLLSGDTVASVAIQEGSQFRPVPRGTRRNGNTLSGDKSLVMDAGAADYLLVSALDEADQFCIAVVPLNTAGLTIQSQRLMDGRQYGSVALENVEVEEWLEGDAVEQGFTRALDEATIMLCCEMLGASRELLERTVAYLQEREQFDVKIGTFQALQHRLATAYCELELAAASVFNALLAMDKGETVLSEHASKAKALVGDILQHLSNEAVQMHGGMGVTDEMDIGLFLKRSRTCNQLFGNSAFHRNRFATLRGF